MKNEEHMLVGKYQGIAREYWFALIRAKS